jgi:hypothetical protein
MDKGKEAINNIEDMLAMTPREGTIESILRSHGWLHEDDVVEGKTKPMCDIPGDLDIDSNCEIVKKGYPSLWVHCNNASFKCPHYKDRPATVKDLIGGK